MPLSRNHTTQERLTEVAEPRALDVDFELDLEPSRSASPASTDDSCDCPFCTIPPRALANSLEDLRLRIQLEIWRTTGEFPHLNTDNTQSILISVDPELWCAVLVDIQLTFFVNFSLPPTKRI